MNPAVRQVCGRASTREVFAVAWRSGPFRADDVMAATGLTRSTTLQALDALVAVNLLEPAPDNRAGEGTRGRPSRWFRVRPDGGAVLGLEAGQHSMTATLMDLAGEVRSTMTVGIDDSDPPHEQEPCDRARLAESLVARVLDQAGLAAPDVVALGVGVPAPVDDEGRTRDGWRGFWRRMHAGLDDVFRRQFPHVRVENDASLAALAERHWGAAQGERHFVALLVTWALGAGVVIDSRLVRGSSGGVGELGFLELVPSVGDSIGLHQYLTSRIMERLAEGPVPPEHPWWRVSSDPLTFKGLAALITPGDPVSAPLFDDITARLANVFGLLAKIYDPAKIVVCGPMVAELEPILAKARKALAAEEGLSVPQIVASELGADVVSLGAAAAARELAGDVAIEWALARRG